MAAPRDETLVRPTDIVADTAYARFGNSGTGLFDDFLSRIHQSFGLPIEVAPVTGATVSIGVGTYTLPDGKRFAVYSDAGLNALTAGQIDLDGGTISTGTNPSFSVYSMPAGFFNKALIMYDILNNALDVVFSDAAATQAAVAAPRLKDGFQPVAIVEFQSTAGGTVYDTLTRANIIQPVIVSPNNRDTNIPLKLSANNPPNNQLVIGPSKVTSNDGTSKTVPPISGALPDFTTTYLGLQAGGSSPPGNVLRQGAAFTCPASIAGQFYRAVFVFRFDGKVDSAFSAGFGSYAALPDPATLFDLLDGLPMGWVDLVGVATSTPGQFKSASSAGSSATTIIENHVAGQPAIFRFGAGGGAGGGGDTSLRVQSINANDALLKKGFARFDDKVFGLEADLTFNLKTATNSTGVVAPGASTSYILALDLRYIPASLTTHATSGLPYYSIPSGTSGMLTILATTLEALDLERYIPLDQLKTDGSSNYAVTAKTEMPRWIHPFPFKSDTKNLEALRQMHDSSPFKWLTVNHIPENEVSSISSLSGAAFNKISRMIEFSANGNFAITSQALDVKFLTEDLRDVGSIDLVLFWSRGTPAFAYNVPAVSGFTIQASRDGGTNWQTVSGMEQVENAFRGTHAFTDELSLQTLNSQSTSGASLALNATTQQALAQEISFVSTSLIDTATLLLEKTGSPAGNIYLRVLRDSSVTPGTPSTAYDAVLAESNAISLSSIASGIALLAINLPNAVYGPGTYHLAIRTDAAYKASFSGGVTELKVHSRTSGAAVPYADTFDGSVWTTATGNHNLYRLIYGRALDLRLRITSGTGFTYPVALETVGVFYDFQDTGVMIGQDNLDQVSFNSVTDNTSTFSITKFLPNKYLKVYKLGTGQVFRYGDFALDGKNVIFPADTFYNGGISATITLLFDQTVGNGFDNSDLNGGLLAANHLGSTDPRLDKSVAGRGIILQRPDGIYRELRINNADGIDVLSVIP